MDPKKAKNVSFASIAVVIIILGAAVFAYGTVGWLFNYYRETNFIAFPSLKIISGLALISLGYIQLELELIRKDQ